MSWQVFLLLSTATKTLPAILTKHQQATCDSLNPQLLCSEPWKFALHSDEYCELVGKVLRFIESYMLKPRLRSVLARNPKGWQDEKPESAPHSHRQLETLSIAESESRRNVSNDN